MPLPHENERAQSGDLSIHYRRLGRPGRTPVVFVHGLSYFSYDWLDAAQSLGDERECVCMDMRGFGDSDWSPAKDYSVPAMARDVVNLLAHLGWQRAVLCGHSMGGRSTAYAAAKAPQRVAGLVLVDYSPENAPAGSRRVAQTVANAPEVFASVDEAMRYFGIDPHSAHGRAKRERFEAYLKPVSGGLAVKRDPHFRAQFRRIIETGERPALGVDMWQVLGEVRCPTLALRGLRSDMFAAETVARMRAANRRMRVLEVDAGHDVAGENLREFLGAVRPFLADLEDKSHEQAA
ncbi:MAG: alpha/beta hydrolase [Betaproteobacteria bacterium]|nr:alpha/beta hydrolase [Betaproteobacteria bacterium]